MGNTKINNLKRFYQHTTQVQWIFPKFFSLFLNSVNVSLFFTEKGRLFHNILPPKHNEFIPKQCDFKCGNCKTLVWTYYCVFTYIWVLLCLNMFYSYVPFICNLSIPVCSCWLGSSIHQHIFSRLASVHSLIAWPATSYRHFCFGFHRLLHFHQFIYVWVGICLNMFHSYVFIHLQSFHPSGLVYGSAGWSTNTFLVAWPAHNLLTAWPASPYKYFCFCFQQTFTYLPVYSSWVVICLNMFHCFAIFTL